MDVLSQKKFYPVIHCICPYEQQGIGHALQNTHIAIGGEADGIFLIGHTMRHSDLIYIYEHVRKHFPNIWIGINFLDTPLHGNCLRHIDSAKKCDNLNALWIDGMPNNRLLFPSTLQVFGGVAFKYKDPHLKGDVLKNACEKAISCVDVATTRGDKTGVVPEISKLQWIQKYLEERIPLALASGVSLENVSLFLPYVDIFLVATSISSMRNNFWHADCLVPEKVKELADKIHGYTD